MNNKALIKFVVSFALIYALGIIVWPAVEEGYSNHFRSFGKTFFEDFRSTGMVWFEEFDQDKNPKFTTKVKLFNKKHFALAQKNRTPVKNGSVTLSAWYSGFLPTLLVLALILSSPVAFRRKMRSIFWGILLVYMLKREV